jgi:tRNA wybutosine-synthesizing protein 2
LSRASAQRGDLAVLVRKKEAKSALEQISANGILDSERKVQTKQSLVEIPIKESLPGFAIIHQEHPEFYKKTPRLSEVMQGSLNADLLELLPRGWFILGDVIIVKILPQLEQFTHQIGEALLSIYPRCSCVLRDFGIEGSFREPVREIIAGKKSETIHRENGVLFKLDARSIMFSQGNLRERMRMSLFGHDEMVVDMFAGIGYFAIPMALHARPKRVLAIEINPIAHRYLTENVKLNHVESIVEPVLGDCAKETPQGVADRVVMGYVGTTNRYLEKGLLALRPGGVLHYHQTIPSWQYPHAARKEVSEASEKLGLKAEILGCTMVKKYSPGMVHAVIDARIENGY